MRSLDEQVEDLDRGIRAQLRARAIPRRQVAPNNPAQGWPWTMSRQREVFDLRIGWGKA